MTNKTDHLAFLSRGSLTEITPMGANIQEIFGFGAFSWDFVGMTCLAPSTLDNIFKEEEVLLPPGGSGRVKRGLARSMSALLTRSRLSRRSFLGFCNPSPSWGQEDATPRARSLGCLWTPGPSLGTPSDAGPGRASWTDPPPRSSLLPTPPVPRLQRVFELAGAGGGERRGRGGGMGERAPKLQTAQLQLQVSGPSLEAIINLRFIFIGELESRLTLAKQGSSSRPWMRLNAGAHWCRQALQARLL